MFKTAILGNLPKISDRPGRPNLRTARNRFDSGTMDAGELEDVIRQIIASVIGDQIGAGIDRAGDGRIRWDDPVTPFAMAHDGFEPGGLIRFFDNNVYYRRPVISGPIRFVQSAVAGDYKFARSVTDRPLLASVCGPFSMAHLCVDRHYHDASHLYADCARLVHAEIEALAHAGADWVQLDEPYLGFCPEEIDAACAAITEAVRGVKTNILVYVYFSPISEVIERLWKLPVQMIGADCISVPANFNALLSGPPEKPRAFGLIDARNTRLEDIDVLLLQLERIAHRRSGEETECWLTPSASLEFLPYQASIAKMKLMGATVREFSGTTIAG
jgi:5-methyltetrahydropteroyltriglutamate--homocysteine methyltransferase